jgi:hypothetical protein
VVAKTQTAWRCSQCGTVNEPGARACSGCGKWPSLFDLQDTVDAPVEEDEALEPELFDPEVFDPETFEAEALEPQPYESGLPDEPETFEPDAEDEEEQSNRGRLRRWAISAIWVIGILVWFVANVLRDR